MRGNGVAGKAEFGRRRGFLDEADEPVGRSDDDAGAGGRHPRRMPEERGVGGRSGQPCTAQPSIPAPDGGDRKAGADERQTGGMHRRDRGAHQRHEPRGA